MAGLTHVRDNMRAFYPPDMPKKWVPWLERAYDEGYAKGKQDVRNPILDALGITWPEDNT